MSINEPVSPRDRSAARKRMKRTGEKYLVALNHIIAERDARLARERRFAFLDEIVPGWRDPEVDSAWKAVADKLSEFVRERGRMPRSNADEDQERLLGAWLSQQRNSPEVITSRFTTERRAHLDENVPGWEGVDRETEWRKNAGALAEFVRDSGRMPKRSAGADGNEKRIGAWIGAQRTALPSSSKLFTPELRPHLDSLVLNWDKSDNGQQWQDNARLLAGFVVTYARTPRLSSSDPHESMLARWLDAQRAETDGDES